MRELKNLKSQGRIIRALVEALMVTIVPYKKIKIYKTDTDISKFIRLKRYRQAFSNHPVFVGKEKLKSKYAADLILNSTSFDKEDLEFTTNFFGFEVKAIFSFMGEVSKFYLPRSLVQSLMCNEWETSSPKTFSNHIIELNTPAITILNLGSGNLDFEKKFYIWSITYLFKEDGKYLVVRPFDYSNTDFLSERTIASRFIEFFLNLAQFYNENEKALPYIYDIIKPDLLTEPLVRKFTGSSSDPDHEMNLKSIGFFNYNLSSNEDIINKLNEVYTRARTSFPFLGQHPVEALENFLLALEPVIEGSKK
jgi:hypothetical protein